MISGPHMNAVVRSGSMRAFGNSVVTTPTFPFQPLIARSTVVKTSTSKRERHCSISRRNRMSAGVRVPERMTILPYFSRWARSW